MLGDKPIYRKDAKQYCGRLVRKAFVPEGAGPKRRQFFTGKVVECPIFDGEVCYRILYDDGDTEDIAWEELVQIMLPEPEAGSQLRRTQAPGLTDTTNRLTNTKNPHPRGKEDMDEGPTAKKPKYATPSALGTAGAGRPAKAQGANQVSYLGLSTPAVSLEAAATGINEQEAPRQGRVRRRQDTPDDGAGGDEAGGDGGHGAVPPPSTRARRGQHEQPGRQEAAGGNKEEEAPAANAGDAARLEEVPAQPAAGGFVARTIGSAGHIARIHLENFMCHKHFELDLGTHVTLVSGQNGSGKSAVMQALQVCLGVTARSTGRGSNLGGFIRTGATDAKVQVTLWNTGDEAFMPHLFGSRITVERQIKKAGASPYVLLDERGRKVQPERGEKPRELLDRILDHFCVDASNPLTIITQDMARQFLSASKDDAKLKYEMFMEGTLQDKTQEELKVSNANCAIIARTLENSAAELNAERQQNAQYRSKLEKLKSADKLVEHRDLLERAAAWRAVQLMEGRLAVATAAAERQGPETIGLCDRHLQALERAKQELLERKRLLGEDMQRHQEVIDNHGKHIRSLVMAVNRAHADMDRVSRDKRGVELSIRTLESDKQALDKRLDEETGGKTAEARRRVEEHQREVTVKQAALQEATERANAAQQAFEAARSQLDILANELQAARNNVMTSEKNVASHRNELQRIAAAQGNRLAMFGAVELNKLIERYAHNFRARPIGPIGALLSISDAKWLMAAEVALGVCFSDYLVSCSQDATLLRQLMAQAKYDRKAAIITTPFDRPLHTISPARRPVGGFAPLLDVLVVQDATAHVQVMNYIVDKFHVESMALVENSLQGRSIMYSGAAGQHISVLVDIEGNFYKGNKDMCYVDRNCNPRRRCRLVADLSQYATEVERDLERYGAELQAHKEDLLNLQHRHREAQMLVTQRDQERKRLLAEKIRAKTDLDRTVTAAPEMPNFDDDEQATAVLSQLSDIQKEVLELQASLQTAEETLALAMQAHDQAVQLATAEKERFQEQVQEGDRLRQALTDVEQQLTEVANLHNNTLTRREQAVSGLEKLRQAVEAADRKVQEAVAAATQVCSRADGEQALADALPVMKEEMARQLSSRRTRAEFAKMSEEQLRKVERASLARNMEYDGLVRHLERVNGNIAKVEKEAGCDLQELEIRLADSDRTVERKLAVHRRIENTVRLFYANYQRQVQYFEKNRAHIEHITMHKFDRYLRRRDHTGRLVFDHTERTLKLLIKPRGKNNPHVQAVEDLKQLSGGERSFTTVAFLLAIGASTESPFRCMDEFDVFMDAINRRVATETLLEFAYENPAFQYIFLTPQDIQAVEDARQEMMKKRKVHLSSAFLRTVQLRPARANGTQA
ncbi:hypothetical protein Agub_g5073 [Astrephomene gubernaculifera]|uniref:Structural maintenance of chromosomes protein 6 n=1 Tax=Astrephomene gubernaculifera TaxID=47775 RepID=A0AAD3DL98_9CHLO|nr:hypothetical protein Agub_g5073 [Astrephomene gubernaculifera]